MDLADTPIQASYRARVRTWLDAHRDEAPDLHPIRDMDERIAAHRAWQGTLAQAGPAGITWPQQYGGQGLGPLEQVVLDQELRHAGVPSVLDIIGLGMLGPTIIAFGSDEQKERYLAPMLHADEVWCQLFSEPGAGSDLAGVQARAVPNGDGRWVINGQKVWTTNAQIASFGMLLARTSPDRPKHNGLTMFIVPMDAPGVTIRGLRQISGEAEFNEVFFDDVELDAGAVVGQLDDGWKTALTTLMFERFTLSLGSDELGLAPERFVGTLARDDGARRDPEIRARLGHIVAELLAVRFGGYRLLTQLLHGQTPGLEAGLSKITIVKAGDCASDLVVDVHGLGALREDSEWGHLVSYMPGVRFGGGTEEILRNTIGERVLGLPPEPRTDKDVPFRELRARERVGSAAR